MNLQDIGSVVMILARLELARNVLEPCTGLLAVVIAALLAITATAAEPPAARTASVRYEPPADESAVPERFRLAAHQFEYREKPLRKVSERLTISLVTFPSPVTSTHVRNNTVHCEYYRPTGEPDATFDSYKEHL